jgi:hypothetical protein
VKDVLLNPVLDIYSVYTIYAAMALYTGAFLTFVWQLSRLSSTNRKLRKTAGQLEIAALSMTVLGFLLHGAGVVMRGIAASRAVLSNKVGGGNSPPPTIHCRKPKTEPKSLQLKNIGVTATSCSCRSCHTFVTATSAIAGTRKTL